MLGEWYRRGIGCGADFNRAFKYYKRATELGDATAHQHLADMYEKGAGIHRDEGMAFLYYRKAAEKGNATGSATVPDGKGGRTPINTLERAFFWYHQAALQGFQPAQFAISGMYRTGAGVPVDPVMADKWAQAAS
ncbi:hypothetical protein BC832DRAFT_528481, partial [Gaertneriomyces semiglobifer]